MMKLNNKFKRMKENNIMHRNLKLQSILIKYIDKEKYIIKLSDYGCSKRLISLSRNCNTNGIGTVIYMAPEILEGKEYNYKCDLWSIGIIIYKLYFGKSPFPAISESGLINNINDYDKGIRNINKTGNKNLDDLIKKLLEKDPLKRLSWDEYFNHPFFINDNIINLIYDVNKDSYFDCNEMEIEKVNIFGEEFVENNKDNIELIINEKKCELVYNYKLEYDEYKIQIIIKNKINKLKKIYCHIK